MSETSNPESAPDNEGETRDELIDEAIINNARSEAYSLGKSDGFPKGLLAGGVLVFFGFALILWILPALASIHRNYRDMQDHMQNEDYRGPSIVDNDLSFENGVVHLCTVYSDGWESCDTATIDEPAPQGVWDCVGKEEWDAVLQDCVQPDDVYVTPTTTPNLYYNHSDCVWLGYTWVQHSDPFSYEDGYCTYN